MGQRNLGRLAFVLITAACAPAWAFGEDERSAIRTVIDRQIEAFRRDDGAAAYAFATPWLQQVFPTQDAFMALVREGYRPVYRPRRYAFGEARETQAGLDQALEVQDEEGADWIAVYSLERQADGSWKIAGCRLVKAPGQSV